MVYASTLTREKEGSDIIMNSKNCSKDLISEMKFKKEG